jgi:hypothetical protein
LNDLGPKLEEAEVHLTSESETEFELLRHLHGDCSPELEKAEVDLASESGKQFTGGPSKALARHVER